MFHWGSLWTPKFEGSFWSSFGSPTHWSSDLPRLTTSASHSQSDKGEQRESLCILLFIIVLFQPWLAISVSYPVSPRSSFSKALCKFLLESDLLIKGYHQGGYVSVSLGVLLGVPLEVQILVYFGIFLEFPPVGQYLCPTHQPQPALQNILPVNIKAHLIRVLHSFASHTTHFQNIM